MNPLAAQNLTTVYKKAEDLDVVVEAFVNGDGKVVRQNALSREQVNKTFATAQTAFDKAVERKNKCLEVLDQA